MPKYEDPLERMLTELRDEYDADEVRARAVQERARAAHAAELQRVRAAHAAEQREKARRFLAQLDPKSREGRWFADFATAYASPLEAAVDYLQARDEAERL